MQNCSSLYAISTEPWAKTGTAEDWLWVEASTGASSSGKSTLVTLSTPDTAEDKERLHNDFNSSQGSHAMCMYLCMLSSCLTFLWHILDQWLVLVVGSLPPAQQVPFQSPHDQQGPSVGHVALSQMPHPHYGVHWVVLVQLLTSYSNQLPSFLGGLLQEVHTEP